MSTSHKTKEEITEHHDEEKVMIQNAKTIAKLLKNSKHCVVYTGAGVSTSAKIPDFRGPNGVWTLKDQGKRPTGGVSIEQAFPTYCHYSLVELLKNNLIKHVVSTNCDGLHLRSGIPTTDISELHGNCYKEICEDCNKVYLRNFSVVSRQSRNSGLRGKDRHKTDRNCDTCGGNLYDTTVAFGENLPTDELEKALNHSKKADLCLVLGTSMRVSPACNLPLMNLEKGGKLVLSNLQITPYDNDCYVRCFSKTDELMKEIMKELQLEEFDRKFDANKSIEDVPDKKLTFKKFKQKIDSRFLSTLSCVSHSIGTLDQVMIGGTGLGDEKYPSIEIISMNGIKKIDPCSYTNQPFINQARWGHSAVELTTTKIMLIGGCDHKYMFNDVHVFDSKDYSMKKIETTGTPMSHRLGHSSTKIGNHVFTFGGQKFISRGKYQYHNDLYCLNLDTMEWSEMKTKGEIPNGKSQHSALIFENYLVIIGGTDGNHLLNEVHCLSLETLNWKKLKFEGMPKSISAESNGIYPSQISSSLIENQILVYGLCGTNMIILDLKTKKCIETESLSGYDSKYSVSTCKKNEAIVWCKKDNKLEGSIFSLK